MKEKMKLLIKNNIQYIFILIASIIICIPLLSKNLDIYRDDGIQHVCRLIGTYESLNTADFLPMIMSNFCNNFGYSWNIFYSPFTAYVPLIFKIFNLSFVNCIKLFMFAITLLSGIAMYKFVFKVTKNKNISVFASIIYILAPYRITDMYIRNALAELASFVFLPIIFNGLYTILNEEKKSYTLAWGAIGLFLTHSVITLYTAILCFIYLLVFIKKLKNKKVLITLVTNLLFVIVITSFFWVGLMQHYLATTYEVFVPGRMQRFDVMKSLKVGISQLFYTSSNQTMIFDIGLVTIIGLILTPLAYKKITKEYRRINTLFLVLGLVLVIMTLKFFPFEKLPNFLTMLQFTFRLFEFTSFFFAFVTAVNFGAIIKNFNFKDIALLSVIICLLLVPYNSKISYEVNFNEKDLIEPVPLTERTGRVHAGMASMEYLPSTAFQNSDYIIDREDVPIILEENSQSIIQNYEKKGSNMSMEIQNVTEETSIELPYIYYLGYRIYVNDQEISYTESDKGFIQISINEDAKITVKYTGTNAMIISFIVSIISFAVLIFISNYSKIKTQLNKNRR